MLRFLRRIHEDERGTTLMEVFVASVVTTAAMAIGFGVLWGFLRHTHGQMALSESQSESRVVLREMMIHLRESSTPGTGGPVARLDWDRVVFHADVAPSDGVLERIEYRLVNCNDGFCDLRIQVTPAVDPTARPLTFDPDDALPPRVLLSGVIASEDEPLFAGIRWNAVTRARVDVPECTPCTLGAVGIDLRVQPMLTRANPGTLRTIEEVRLRNA